jgi:nitrate reductase beta subunit
MMYLPRLCEHCLNPACVASCPSGSIYKREEDGIVLIDQDKCRGWRMCVSGCPYKKIYYNWKSGKAEKCIFCFPRIEAGQPTVCSETCVGRIRYLGVLLYDADRIEEAASTEHDRNLYQAQLRIFLDPHDPRSSRRRPSTASPTSGWRLRAIARSTRWRCNGRWRCRCTRSTARCRWSGTCRRSPRSVLRPRPGSSAAMARSRTSSSCASPFSTSPTC